MKLLSMLKSWFQGKSNDAENTTETIPVKKRNQDMPKTFEEVTEAAREVAGSESVTQEKVTDLTVTLQHYLTDHKKEAGQRQWIGVKNALWVLSSKKWKDTQTQAVDIATTLLDSLRSMRGMPFSKVGEREYQNSLWKLDGVLCYGAPGIPAKLRWELRTRGEGNLFYSFPRQEDAVAVVEGRKTLAP